MHDSERIFKQIVASGREWKGCEHCGRWFEAGEILTAVQIHSGMVVYWECSECIEQWLGPYDDELKLQPPLAPPGFALIKLNPDTKTFECVSGPKISVHPRSSAVRHDETTEL
jgi:hypothetical protein